MPSDREKAVDCPARAVDEKRWFHPKTKLRRQSTTAAAVLHAVRRVRCNFVEGCFRKAFFGAISSNVVLRLFIILFALRTGVHMGKTFFTCNSIHIGIEQVDHFVFKLITIHNLYVVKGVLNLFLVLVFYGSSQFRKTIKKSRFYGWQRG